jgi:hypothetical protein
MIAIAIDDEPKALDIVRVFVQKVPYLELGIVVFLEEVCNFQSEIST